MYDEWKGGQSTAANVVCIHKVETQNLTAVSVGVVDYWLLWLWIPRSDSLTRVTNLAGHLVSRQSPSPNSSGSNVACLAARLAGHWGNQCSGVPSSSNSNLRQLVSTVTSLE